MDQDSVSMILSDYIVLHCIANVEITTSAVHTVKRTIESTDHDLDAPSDRCLLLPDCISEQLQCIHTGNMLVI